MKEKALKNKTVALENWKYVILAALAVVILAGSAVLFWQIEKQNSPQGDAFAGARELQAQVDELNKKIDDLNRALEEAKSQSGQTTVKTTTGKVAGASTSNSSANQSKININTASLSQLDSLPGIGPTYAQRIIDYREANGGFQSIEEIKNIKGIGDKTFEKFKDQITI
ncbi:MAG: helix-hairpin-helix domain-containing protein [Candidatus Berkelbacteria bacterium]|nr:helix-hairpin-helix domain-containing protein [Candidatus Berkelbacteria bacterium]